MKALKITLLLVISLMILGFASIFNPDKTISEKVAEKEDLSTLMTALEAAELVEVLKGEGPYTVFAPTNKAFAELPEGKLEDLLKPEHKGELAKILKYHVVAGKIFASDIGEEQMIKTLEGSELRILNQKTTDDYMGDESEAMNSIMVNNAIVTNADIEVSNGVIHIIDGVVMPSNQEVLGAMEQNEEN
ncbi:MAG: fasciclin domain-containing protein [Aliifodinibius sp.]|nr:fasciclin domain-containing protein [Fodinibius sp.]NIV10733.1 fasciclin domain-containing protein [Fodinibius sp.]NIY24355.1 fasciclin domain-containing protein [Fodinibius sp.]